MPDVTIFGNAILDVLVSPVDKSMFDNEATPVNTGPAPTLATAEATRP